MRWKLGERGRQDLDVNKEARARQKGQRPRVVWFTGLPGAGKSTVANAVEKALLVRGRHSYLLDGDNLRLGLSRDGVVHCGKADLIAQS